ncbi:hypothetical protein [Nocardia xishanensis]
MAVAPSLLLPFTAFATGAVHPAAQGPDAAADRRARRQKKDRELERQLWDWVVRAERTRLEQLAATEHPPEEVYERMRDQSGWRSVRADPEASDEDAAARAARNLPVVAEDAGPRRSRWAARKRRPHVREPACCRIVDRMTERFDLGPTR